MYRKLESSDSHVDLNKKRQDVSLVLEWISKWKSDKLLKIVIKSENDINAIAVGTSCIVTWLIIFWAKTGVAFHD